MNILIYGKFGSGKTILANALAEYYKKNHQKVAILEDNDFTASFKQYQENLAKAKVIFAKTKGNQNQHTIAITPAIDPKRIYGFYDTETQDRLYDYYYCATRG